MTSGDARKKTQLRYNHDRAIGANERRIFPRVGNVFLRDGIALLQAADRSQVSVSGIQRDSKEPFRNGHKKNEH